MGLPTGESPISFSQIRTEFGDGTNTATSPVRLGQYRTTDPSFTNESPGDFSNLPLDTGIPTSGAINVDSFHGKKLNVIVDYYSGSDENRPDDARTKYQAASASGNRVVVGGYKDRVIDDSSGSKVIIHVNKTIGSATGNVNNCAVRTGSFESGTDLTVDVGSSGKIFGAGGDGGDGSSVQTEGDAGPGENGSDGSSALGVSHSGTVVNVASGGIISKGYGGGGGGGASWGQQENSGKPKYHHQGSGGGGGAGRPAGEGGARTTGDVHNANPGADGSLTSAGSGGAAPSDHTHGNEGGFAGGGKGGDGGDAEQSAENGNQGEFGGGEWEEGPVREGGGTAGGDGAAIRRTSGITVTIGTNNGTITGSTTATGVN